MSEFYISDDYIGIESKNAKFYYGYEVVDDRDNWCFQAIVSGKETIIPFSKLKNNDDMFSVTDCFLEAMEIFFDENKVTKNE